MKLNTPYPKFEYLKTIIATVTLYSHLYSYSHFIFRIEIPLFSANSKCDLNKLFRA